MMILLRFAVLSVLATGCLQDVNVPIVGQTEETGKRKPSRTSPGTSGQGGQVTPNFYPPGRNPGAGTAIPGNPNYPNAPLVLPGQGLTNTECIEADAFTCEVELAIVRMTNEKRATRNLPPVEHHGRIAYVSRLWSIGQSERGRIGHSGFPAQRRRDYQAKFGTNDVSLSAENVAYSSMGRSTSAEGVASRFVTMWWNSSGHKRNMLGSRHKYLGTGIYRDARGRVYATQIFGR